MVHGIAKFLGGLLGVLRRIAVLLVLLAMLAFNVASFAFEQIGEVFSDLADFTFRTAWVADVVASADDLRAENSKLTKTQSELASRNKALADEATDLRARNKILTDKATDLADEAGNLRARNKVLAGKASDLADEALNLRLNNTTLTRNLDSANLISKNLDKFDELGRKIARRTAVGAARNITSIPVESVPVVGVLTILAVTAVEVREACATFNELQELRSLADIPPLDNLMADTCDYVPFSGGIVEISEMSIAECREQATDLRNLDLDASELLDDQCNCIERHPGFEAVCFPELIDTEEGGEISPG